MVLNNKRGAFEWGFFGSLLVVLVVVVLAILFFSGVFSDIGRKAGTTPGAESFATEVCAGLAQQGGAGAIQSYCYQFREVEKDIFISCEFPEVKQVLRDSGVQPLDVCRSELIQSNTKEICDEVSATKKDDVRVNGETCENFEKRVGAGSSGDTGGQNDTDQVITYDWAVGSTCPQGTEIVSNTFCDESTQDQDTQVCCQTTS